MWAFIVLALAFVVLAFLSCDDGEGGDTFKYYTAEGDDDDDDDTVMDDDDDDDNDNNDDNDTSDDDDDDDNDDNNDDNDTVYTCMEDEWDDCVNTANEEVLECAAVCSDLFPHYTCEMAICWKQCQVAAETAFAECSALWLCYDRLAYYLCETDCVADYLECLIDTVCDEQCDLDSYSCQLVCDDLYGWWNK